MLNNGGMMLTGQNITPGRMKLCECHFVHHKSHRVWLGIESGFPRWEAGVWTPELWCGPWVMNCATWVTGLCLGISGFRQTFEPRTFWIWSGRYWHSTTTPDASPCLAVIICCLFIHAVCVHIHYTAECLMRVCLRVYIHYFTKWCMF